MPTARHDNAPFVRRANKVCCVTFWPVQLLSFERNRANRPRVARRSRVPYLNPACEATARAQTRHTDPQRIGVRSLQAAGIGIVTMKHVMATTKCGRAAIVTWKSSKSKSKQQHRNAGGAFEELRSDHGTVSATLATCDRVRTVTAAVTAAVLLGLQAGASAAAPLSTPYTEAQSIPFGLQQGCDHHR